MENGEFQELIALCRIQKDGHPRLQKCFNVTGYVDTQGMGTKDLKSRGFFAVIPVPDNKKYTFGTAEEFFCFVKENMKSSSFVSTLCPDSSLLIEHANV